MRMKGDVMEGEIIAVQPVLMESGMPHHIKTVIYERNGMRYRGCAIPGLVTTYYFGDDSKAKFSSDIDIAWERAFVGGPR